MGDTQVTGSVEPLVACTKLSHLFLWNTQVWGSVEPLAACTRLRYLSLIDTSVTGDPTGLQCLYHNDMLTTLRLPESMPMVHWSDLDCDTFFMSRIFMSRNQPAKTSGARHASGALGLLAWLMMPMSS